jgi:hypothetical protein
VVATVLAIAPLVLLESITEEIDRVVLANLAPLDNNELGAKGQTAVYVLIVGWAVTNRLEEYGLLLALSAVHAQKVSTAKDVLIPILARATIVRWVLSNLLVLELLLGTTLVVPVDRARLVVCGQDVVQFLQGNVFSAGKGSI